MNRMLTIGLMCCCILLAPGCTGPRKAARPAESVWIEQDGWIGGEAGGE